MITINNSELSNIEKNWFQLLLNVPFKYRELILHQIEHATFTRDYTDYYILLKLHHRPDTEKIPKLGGRVPIVMVVQHGITADSHDIAINYHANLEVSCITNEHRESPTEFLLHVYDGFVQQLEIYNVDSSKINLSNMCEGRVDYCVLPTIKLL